MIGSILTFLVKDDLRRQKAAQFGGSSVDEDHEEVDNDDGRIGCMKVGASNNNKNENIQRDSSFTSLT